MRFHLLTTAIISAMLASTTTQAANLGNLVEDIKKTGGHVVQQSVSGSSAFDNATLINGLKEALSLGSERAIDLVSSEGGYLNDAQIRIPMPKALQKLSKPLRKLGMGEQIDSFESAINQAAEKAAPAAASILSDTLKSMSFEDAQKIYSGPDDAATQYFREKSSASIAELFKPEIDKTLESVEATRSYKALASQAASLPLIGKEINTDLSQHVTNAALEGLFIKLAAEEKAIRTNPAARTTDLLQQLWGK